MLGRGGSPRKVVEVKIPQQILEKELLKPHHIALQTHLGAYHLKIVGLTFSESVVKKTRFTSNITTITDLTFRGVKLGRGDVVE